MGGRLQGGDGPGQIVYLIYFKDRGVPCSFFQSTSGRVVGLCRANQKLKDLQDHGGGLAAARPLAGPSLLASWWKSIGQSHSYEMRGFLSASAATRMRQPRLLSLSSIFRLLNQPAMQEWCRPPFEKLACQPGHLLDRVVSSTVIASYHAT